MAYIVRHRMKPRKVGCLRLAVRVASIPERAPSHEFAEWLAGLSMNAMLEAFFRDYTPHGIRNLGVTTLIGSPALLEIDSRYATTTQGRVLPFGQCGDGSYVGVNIDTAIPCWIMKGHLEPDYLADGIVIYPGSLAMFLISAAWNPRFPFDPFEAEKRFIKYNRRTGHRWRRR